jgi:4,5-dihydroxyphthalate decarboxylase
VTGGGPIRLSVAVSPVLHHQALLDRTVTIPGVELCPVPPAGEYAARFKRMCRDLAYDVCELSVMSYYTAREYGLPISAIPVVPIHQFHHRDFLKNVHAGIESPLDLAGKRVGTRTYTVTPGVLDRGILSDEFGLDLDSVTWVLAEEEHVEQVQAHYPPNVVPGRNENLFPRLASGDLDAGIAGSNLRRERSPDVVPLFTNAAELDRAQYERTGIVPAFTLIAVKTAVLDEHPWLAEALYLAFVAARAAGLEPDPGVAEIVDGDPVPIGLSANRATFEELLILGRKQRILTGSFTVEDLFPTLDLCDAFSYAF